MNSEVLKLFMQLSLVIVPAILAFILGGRRRKAIDLKSEAEAIGEGLSNVQKEVSIYKSMMLDLKNTLQKANDDYEKLEQQFFIVFNEKEKCLKENDDLRKEIDRLAYENIQFYKKLNTCEFDCELKKRNK